MKINSVCILGGGSAGWMTAAALSVRCPWLDITLIESKKLGTIGVGESTLGRINAFLRMLGITDDSWMPHCNATYKASIKFTNFREPGSEFHYPFGSKVWTSEPDIMQYFAVARAFPDLKPEDFARYYHDTMPYIESNRVPPFGTEGFYPDDDLAYHMDAGLFGEYLRDTFCQNVNHIDAEVKQVWKNISGEIDCLETLDRKKYHADLFVDCSGFKSMLLGKTMNESYISYREHITNNKAWATQIPYIDKESEMELFTNCTALSSGWVWNIPLYNRIGTGYVFNSDFQSPEDAETEFREHLGERGQDANLRLIDIHSGIYENVWSKNVIGVGLSAGFLEPLESTGLLMTHEIITFLVRTLLQREGKVNNYMKEQLNCAARDMMTSFSEFIAQHYANSLRDDTPYWKHVTSIDYFPKGKSSHDDYAIDMIQNGKIVEDGGGINYIMAGMGVNPITDAVPVNAQVPEVLKTFYNKYKERWKTGKDRAENLPSHYEYLKEHYYAGHNSDQSG